MPLLLFLLFSCQKETEYIQPIIETEDLVSKDSAAVDSGANLIQHEQLVGNWTCGILGQCLYTFRDDGTYTQADICAGYSYDGRWKWDSLHILDLGWKVEVLLLTQEYLRFREQSGYIMTYFRW